MGVATPEILSHIQKSESVFTRIAALKALKNEIVGHDQKKESWIKSGIIPALLPVLKGCKDADRSSNKLKAHARNSQGRSDIQTSDDEACFHAAIVLGSLAQGGSAFVAPILAGDTLPCLLSVLSSHSCPDSLTVAILQTLNIIADKIPLGYQLFDSQSKYLSSLVFSKDNIGSLCRILERTPDSDNVQRSIDLSAALIAKLCTEESHKNVLAEAGVLDALALKLAAFVVAQGFVLPGAENLVGTPGTLDAIPAPAPDNAQLAPILRAIAVIVEHSKSRAEHLLTSPAMVTVFPKQFPEFQPFDTRKSPWGTSYFGSLPGRGPPQGSPIDSLLPSVPLPLSKSQSFPPLGSGSSYAAAAQAIMFNPLPDSPPGLKEEESALIPWLFHLARSESGFNRLMAARLITSIFRLGLARKHRITTVSYLLIPLLLRMLDTDYEIEESSDPNLNNSASPTLRLKEEAPAILASLVTDNRDLQKNAVDGGALKKLPQLLKSTFNGGDAQLEKPMWSESAEPPTAEACGRADSCLGATGLPPLIMHKMRFREGILKALAALLLQEETYRKSVCDNGVVPYIIDSMKPYDPEASTTITSDKVDSLLKMNPVPTLLAACAAARSLTRSPSVLRTSLTDAGIAAPMFTLSKFRDIDVQIAAIAVISNLSLDFSPMKTAILDANMLSVLCEHSHSSNKKLRIESIWALKHMAYDSKNDIKIQIIERLEPGWIKQILCQDVTAPVRNKTDPDGAVVEMTSPNAAGDPVSLLNSFNGGTAQQTEMEEQDQRMTDVGNPKASPDMRRWKLAHHANSGHMEQSWRDDIAVQEQTLDLIRNIICGEESVDMIDYLFREFGQSEFLEILANKIRPKPLLTGGRRDSISSKTASIPSEILIATTYVLIHLAAGAARHRNLVVNHRELIPLMLPLFNHSNSYVRVNCVWFVINLIMKDHETDHQGCIERAEKLRGYGVMDRLASLERDAEADVRERLKTAMYCMNDLLG